MVRPALLLLSLSLSVAGCFGTDSIRSEPLQKGEQRVFRAPMPQVLPAVRRALDEVGVVAREETLGPVTVLLLGERDVTAFSWGENVRVVVHGATPYETEVSVLSKRRLATNITAKSTESFAEDIFAHVERELGVPPR